MCSWTGKETVMDRGMQGAGLACSASRQQLSLRPGGTHTNQCFVDLRGGRAPRAELRLREKGEEQLSSESCLNCDTSG